MTKAFARARLSAAALTVLAVMGCSKPKEEKKEIDPLTAAINALPEGPVKSPEDLSAARAAAVEMQATLDEIQKDLVDLRVKELKAIKTSLTVAQEGRSSTSTRETLKAEIEEIRRFVRLNLDKLDALQSASRASNERVETLERLVRDLHQQFEEKEQTILALEEKTRELAQTAEGLRGTVKEKEDAVQQMRAALSDREARLATAFVLIAPKGDLRKVGFVEKKGSVLGLGGNWQRTGRFDESLFRQVDIRKATRFEIAAPPEKVLILSDHPKDSYVLAPVSPTECALTVRDPALFWRMSRQLIILLPD